MKIGMPFVSVENNDEDIRNFLPHIYEERQLSTTSEVIEVPHPAWVVSDLLIKSVVTKRMERLHTNSHFDNGSGNGIWDGLNVNSKLSDAVNT
jgi:hypothetical protein